MDTKYQQKKPPNVPESGGSVNLRQQTLLYFAKPSAVNIVQLPTSEPPNLAADLAPPLIPVASEMSQSLHEGAVGCV
ncbi:UNVERIFIED_CONTAM: hypothetical protein HDU68_008724 [Siphonaria sp. JEL0065]|nr:hypothetical protein HDU68_008724 [Siphonaria sp. JEL0065]